MTQEWHVLYVTHPDLKKGYHTFFKVNKDTTININIPQEYFYKYHDIKIITTPTHEKVKFMKPLAFDPKTESIIGNAKIEYLSGFVLTQKLKEGAYLLGAQHPDYKNKVMLRASIASDTTINMVFPDSLRYVKRQLSVQSVPNSGLDVFCKPISTNKQQAADGTRYLGKTPLQAELIAGDYDLIYSAGQARTTSRITLPETYHNDTTKVVAVLECFDVPTTANNSNKTPVNKQDFATAYKTETNDIILNDAKRKVFDSHGTEIGSFNTTFKRNKAIECGEVLTAKEVIAEEHLEEGVFDVVEDMPQFPGGDAAMFTYLNTNIKYPKVAEENGVQGRVICKFVVDEDGSIKNVKVVRSVDPSLDKEAVRVIKSMPKWKPGKQNGKAVRVSFTTPVTFRLQ